MRKGPSRETYAKIADTRKEQKKHKEKHFVFLDLEDIRIVRGDEFNLRVDLKRGSTWVDKGFYSTPEGAIRKALNLSLNINQKLAIEGLLTIFENTVKNILLLAEAQSKKWAIDTDGMHRKARKDI